MNCPTCQCDEHHVDMPYRPINEGVVFKVYCKICGSRWSAKTEKGVTTLFPMDPVEVPLYLRIMQNIARNSVSPI